LALATRPDPVAGSETGSDRRTRPCRAWPPSTDR
jgi:hypothetical protein